MTQTALDSDYPWSLRKLAYRLEHRQNCQGADSCQLAPCLRPPKSVTMLYVLYRALSFRSECECLGSRSTTTATDSARGRGIDREGGRRECRAGARGKKLNLLLSLTYYSTVHGTSTSPGFQVLCNKGSAPTVSHS